MNERAARGRARNVAAVGLGGALGTAARAGTDALLGSTAPWPWSTFTVNIIGALLLGAVLARRPAGTVRLLAATGFLGAFTTYSAFAVQAVAMASDGAPGAAATYALGSLALGILAFVAGASIVARTDRGTGESASAPPGERP